MNNDLISRSVAINLLNEAQVEFDEYYKGLGKAKTIIDNAPTVEYTFAEAFQKTVCDNKLYCPARPKGEWLDEKFVAFHLTCNKCGCNIRRQKEEVFEGDYAYNFCPNCGADMRGEKKC